MKIEIVHRLNDTYPNGIEKTEKKWKLFGIVVCRKTYHYPKLKKYDVMTLVN